MAMTKQEFKKRLESNDEGGGILFEDITDCVKEWGLAHTPRICPINGTRYQVLKAAGVEDAEDFKPE